MVMHVYTKEDLKIETEKIAQKIAQGAPMAIMYMKKMLNKSYANLKDFLDEEALVQTFCLWNQKIIRKEFWLLNKNVNLIFKANNKFRNI